MTRRRSLRLATIVALAVTALNVALASVTNVPTRVTASDAATFRTVLGLQPGRLLAYEQEIALIARVQRLVLSKAPLGTAIPDRHPREPEDLFRAGAGLCYDRARTFDKVFAWLGFETRHVFILYPVHPITAKRIPYWRALIMEGSPSHSVTEVRTKRGWLVVDSNSAWISVTARGEPVDADRIPTRAREFRQVPEYFSTPYLAIRGLYSRRGHLYPPYLPYPDLNWEDLWEWALDRGGPHPS